MEINHLCKLVNNLYLPNINLILFFRLQLTEL